MQIISVGRDGHKLNYNLPDNLAYQALAICVDSRLVIRLCAIMSQCIPSHAQQCYWLQKFQYNIPGNLACQASAICVSSRLVIRLCAVMSQCIPSPARRCSWLRR